MLSCGQRVCEMDCTACKKRWQNREDAYEASAPTACGAGRRPQSVVCSGCGVDEGWLVARFRSRSLLATELDVDDGDRSNPGVTGLY